MDKTTTLKENMNVKFGKIERVNKISKYHKERKKERKKKERKKEIKKKERKVPSQLETLSALPRRTYVEYKVDNFMLIMSLRSNLKVFSGW